MSKIFMYPTLTESLEEKLMIEITPIDFYYSGVTDVYENIQIVVEDIDDPDILLKDLNGKWDYRINNLIIRQNLKINDCEKLFGVDGLINSESTIGVAVIWSSRDSKIQNSKKIGEITVDSSKFDKEISLMFAPGYLRQSIKYSIIIYLEKSKGDVEYFASTTGNRLGTLFEKRIIMEGNESIFPIVSIESSSEPLWKLVTEWGDYQEKFEDSVRLVLNKNHRDYKYLDTDNKLFNEELFNEILTTVMIQIIISSKERNEIDTILDFEGHEIGTIGYLIKYYIETYTINTSNVGSIVSSIIKGVRG